MMFRPESTPLYFSGISATSNEGKFSLEQAFDLLFFAKCYKFFLVLGYLNKKASEKTFIFANGDLVAHCDINQRFLDYVMESTITLSVDVILMGVDIKRTAHIIN